MPDQTHRSRRRDRPAQLKSRHTRCLPAWLSSCAAILVATGVSAGVGTGAASPNALYSAAWDGDVCATRGQAETALQGSRGTATDEARAKDRMERHRPRDADSRTKESRMTDSRTTGMRATGMRTTGMRTTGSRMNDSRTTSKLIDDLYARQWRNGHGTRMLCLGDSEERRALRMTFDLQDLVRTGRSDGSAVLSAFEDRRTHPRQTDPGDARDKRRQGRSLASARIDLPAPSSWVPDKSDPDALNWREHGRRAGRSCCTLPFTIELSVKRVDGSVHIEQRVFVAGELDEHVVWSLDS